MKNINEQHQFVFMVTIFFLIFLGIVFLYWGAESIIKGASNVAIKFGMTPLVVGMTIVAIGTSMPEAMASIVAQIKDNRGDIAIGNIIGSNIANIALVLGLILLVRPLPIPKKLIETPILLIVSIVFAILMLGQKINRYEGILLLTGMIIFCWYQIKQHKETTLPKNKQKIHISVALIILGIILLALGGNYLIDGCVKLSQMFNIEGRVIGLTIVALGTSAPEMATSLVAIIRKKSSFALGNIIGSNIFNILFVSGSVATIKPIITNFGPFLYDLIIMLSLTIILSLMTWKQKKLSAKHGIIFLLIYLIYFATII